MQSDQYYGNLISAVRFHSNNTLVCLYFLCFFILINDLQMENIVKYYRFVLKVYCINFIAVRTIYENVLSDNKAPTN